MSSALRFLLGLAAICLASCASTVDVGPVYLGGFARAFAWSPDGAQLVAVRRTDLRVFDGRSFELQRTVDTLDAAAGYRIHQSPASATFSRDGSVLATAAFDAGMTIWDTHSWERLLRIPASEKITSIAFAGESKQLIGAGPRGPLALWDSRSGQRLWTAIEEPSGIVAIAASRDGKWLAAGTQGGRVVLWDLPAHTVVAQSEIQPGSVLSVAFSPDGSTLASTAECSDVRVWDTASGVLAQHPIDPAATSPERARGQAILGLAALLSNITSFRSNHSPSGAIATTSRDGAPVFDCQLAFSPDGRLLGVVHHSEELTGSYHTEIFDLERSELLSRVHGTMSGVAFNPDGSIAATSGILHLLLFDPRTGEEKARTR